MLEKVAKKFAGDRLAVLTINGDRRKKSLDRTLERVNTSLPVLRDKESKVFETYRAYAIPTIYLIDQQGKIYSAWTGAIENLENELGKNVAFMLKHREVAEIAEATAEPSQRAD